MKQRIITALILAPLVILAIFFLPMAWFSAFVGGLCLVGFWEWSRLLKPRNLALTMLPGVVLCGLILLYFNQNLTLLYKVNATDHFVLGVSALWWCLASLLVITFPRSQLLWSGSKWLKQVFGMLTIVPFFLSILILKAQLIQVDPYYGARLVIFVCFIVWAADTGAYFFGKFTGKRKMAPHVSPNKTIEGLIGGVVTSLAISSAMAYWLDIHFVSHWALLGIVFITVLASVMGDLVESMFKREAGIKDSSRIIPGHGGLLDRIDSLTAAFPIFAFLYFIQFIQ